MQNSNSPDYKSTIRLPQTDFPMKGDLPIREPQIIAGWEKNNIYQKLQEKNKNGPGFTMPDGPPYANGSIHIGHAMNKSLKDFVIKYKNMQGYSAPFIPGWDCHGLPIEHKVMKDLSDKKITKTDQEILALCREEANKWVNHQREQFKRLGVLADWENPYLTMSKQYEAEEVREFARAFKRGVIYQGVKPVYWNWTLKTALADAEIEYHDKVSPSIYVKFNITDDRTLAKLGNPKGTTSYVIWTTTPWTLPANVGIALHPEFDYGVFSTRAEGAASTDGENLVIAKSLKEFFEKDSGLSLTEVSTVKGADLDLTEARHPFLDRKSIVVLADHVTADAGTGAVHTAPGHGADDFRVGQKYNLPIINPVAENGTYTEDFPEMQGMNIFKANPVIIEKLKASGHLIKHTDITHSYPHCWRSKTPLIFRTTAQWFIGIDQEGSEIRKNTLKAMNDVQFFPEWGKARFEAMMQNRPDWCLSRQRIWGVPIPIFYHEETGKPLADVDVMMRAADVVEAGGIEAFYNTPAEKIVGKPGYKHGRDILDVWFDSGVCHAAVQAKRGYKNVQADIYLEGSDQHRGWFNTSMLSSMSTTGKPPFKALITHGFVNDSQGRKMSKSLGNVVDPNEITKQSGSEIVRLWASSVDYGTDVGCGKEELTRVTETYRKIRNTMRFLLGAINDFDASKDQIEVAKMPMIDRWMMHQLNKLITEVTKAYECYEFYKVYQLLNHFFTVTLSATYMDILKDRLYTWKADGLERRSTQTVYHHVTTSVLRMMAPILTFLAEESYGYIKNKAHDSILLESFPKANASWSAPDLDVTFDDLLRIRSEAQKKLEELRTAKTIGASLEASLKVTADGEAFAALEKLNNSHAKCNLREFFIVSNVTLVKGPLAVTAVKADGEKCLRCWVYDTLSTAASTQGLCPKCVEALT